MSAATSAKMCGRRYNAQADAARLDARAIDQAARRALRKRGLLNTKPVPPLRAFNDALFASQGCLRKVT